MLVLIRLPKVRDNLLWFELVPAFCFCVNECRDGGDGTPHAGCPELRHLSRLSLYRSLVSVVALVINVVGSVISLSLIAYESPSLNRSEP